MRTNELTGLTKRVAKYGKFKGARSANRFFVQFSLHCFNRCFRSAKAAFGTNWSFTRNALGQCFQRGSRARMLCRRAAKGQDLASALRALQEVGPILHHLGAWLQIEGVIIGGAHGVTWRVGKLQFDVVMVIALLVQDVDAKPRKPWPVMRPLYPIRSNAFRIVMLDMDFLESCSPGR